MRRLILVLSTLLVLLIINYGIYQRELLTTNGRVILLELAPVDPRSLMQGDYMALRFKVANQAFNRKMLEEEDGGYLVLELDDHNVASFKRFADESALADNEVLMRYRIRNGRAKFATNAFFFQEGHAKHYDTARFGEFRVASDGEAILTNLLNKDFATLGPDNRG